MSVEKKATILGLVRSQIGGAQVANELLVDGPVRYECEIWDYKLTQNDDAIALGELARDVVSFHNAYGGYIIIGVSDDYKVVGFNGTVNEQTLRQKIRHYFGADVAVLITEAEITGMRVVVVVVPKRTGQTVVASRAGPTLANGKPAFQPGAVYFRVNDACQLIRGSEDLQFLATARVHSLEDVIGETTIPQSNLPDRSAICPRLIGRSDVKSGLWLWLADRLSRYRVVAGPGGFGKTSAAYYFAEDVSDTSANGFYQVLWLSAKKQQFSGAKNAFETMPYSSDGGNYFYDIESLLSVLAESLAVSGEEWEEASPQDRIELLRIALETIPSFVVLDDLDSLTPDEQRQVVQIVMQIASGGSKFLLTTRNNFVAPDASTTRMPGLQGEEFKQYTDVLSGRFGRSLNDREIGELEIATQGSPLFAESVFRLMKLGSRFGEALKLWKGKDGEAARAACFKREVKNLTLKARRAIFAMSRVDSASLPELCQFAELERVEAEQALLELDQLFLCSSAEIAGEPRFSVPENLRRLLDDEKKELVPEFLEIERRVAALKKEAAGGGKMRGRNAPIAAAINQAMAQLGNGDNRGACATVDAALESAKESADLWMVKARCYYEAKPVNVELVRGAFEKSYSLGKREPVLFDKWLDFESESGNTNAAVDVGEKGMAAFDEPSYIWMSRVGLAYFRRGDQRLRRGEAEDASQDFRTSLQRLARAYRASPVSARASVEAAIERSSERLWTAMPINRGASGTIQVLRVAKDALSSGDKRVIWGERSGVALGALARAGVRLSDSEIDSVRLLVEGLERHLLPDAYAKLKNLSDRIFQAH